MKRLTLVACLILLLLIPSVYATESVVVSGLSQSTAARGTTLTVTVTGSGFTDGRASGSSIYIYKCGAVSPGGTNPPISGSVISWSPTSITASFSLGSAIKVGEYGVKVHTIDPVFGDNWGYKVNVLQVYDSAGAVPDTETTTTGTVTTTTSSEDTGENSVFFDTSPSGAEVWLDGNDAGTSAFVYKTDNIGTHDVVIKKTGYNEYDAKVTILKGQRVNFYAQLEPLSSSDETASPTQKVSGTTGSQTAPSANVTTIRKSTLKIPTPLGTDPEPTTEESPIDPAVVVLAAALGIGAVVIRRR